MEKRLSPELRLAKITNVAAASRYLSGHFMHDYNVCFAVPPAAKATACIPYACHPLEEIHCVQEDRQVYLDN